MSGQHAAKPEPVTGEVYWRVAEMARKRGWISRTGRTPGKPNLLDIMRATGLSYQTVYMLLRKPAKVRRVDVATLERLCAVFECEPGELLGIDWRYSPHPRAHTAKLNPLSAEHRLPWPESFYRRCVADQYELATDHEPSPEASAEHPGIVVDLGLGAPGPVEEPRAFWETDQLVAQRRRLAKLRWEAEHDEFVLPEYEEFIDLDSLGSSGCGGRDDEKTPGAVATDSEPQSDEPHDTKCGDGSRA
jgi:DNA-binding Xre family transcriptional regulator